MKTCSILASLFLALLIARPAAAAPYQTTYGEDPIPDAHLVRRPPITTYGQDPVPAKSLSQRVWEFRNRPARLAPYMPGVPLETRPGGPTLVPSQPHQPSARRRW